MIELETYIAHFGSLRRAPNAIFTETTKNRAPHKPILILAILDLIARDVITSPVIDVTGDLVDLNEAFNLYWRCIMPAGQASSVAFPFSRLHNEPFWKLLPVNGKEITPAVVSHITNVTHLRHAAAGARIDDDLFYHMQNPAGRGALRDALLSSSFSPEARVVLEEQAIINAQAFDYSNKLEQMGHEPLVREMVASKGYKPAARDQGFRRAVVSTYDHRCALCGVRMISVEGHTAVDAAHIVPWSKSKNDDIRNGMALCKLCHWGFDKGMMGVSGTYEVITSRHIGANRNVPGFLMTLCGRGIIGPLDRNLWPDEEYLAQHRRRWHL